MPRLTALLFLIMTLMVKANNTIPAMTVENGYVEPFKLFDNLYYVGDKWVSSYAVVTSDGLVLIDTLDFPYSQWIPNNLKKLGLGDMPITHVMVTHGHSDHVGGAAYLQSIYSADVLMTEASFALASSQSAASVGKRSFQVPKPSDFILDNTVRVLGDTRFKFYVTAGHTDSDMSIEFDVTTGGKHYRAFVVGGHAPNKENPELAAQAIFSMDRIKQIASIPPMVEVNLANHPHKNQLFERRDGKIFAEKNNPYIDSASFFKFIEQQQQLALAQVKLKSSLKATNH